MNDAQLADIASMHVMQDDPLGVSPTSTDSAALTGDTCKHHFNGRRERGEADRAFLPRRFTDSKSDAAIGTKAMANRGSADRSRVVPSKSSRDEEGYVARVHDQVDSIASCLRFRAEAGAVQGGVTIPQLNACAYARRRAGAWRSLLATDFVLATIRAGTSGTGHAAFRTLPGIADATVAKIRGARLADCE